MSFEGGQNDVIIIQFTPREAVELEAMLMAVNRNASTEALNALDKISYALQEWENN